MLLGNSSPDRDGNPTASTQQHYDYCSFNNYHSRKRVSDDTSDDDTSDDDPSDEDTSDDDTSDEDTSDDDTSALKYCTIRLHAQCKCARRSRDIERALDYHPLLSVGMFSLSLDLPDRMM